MKHVSGPEMCRITEPRQRSAFRAPLARRG